MILIFQSTNTVSSKFKSPIKLFCKYPIKARKRGAGEMAHGLKAHTAPREYLYLVPREGCSHRIASNSISRGPDDLFWPPQVLLS